jgi:hypothetical protein
MSRLSDRHSCFAFGRLRLQISSLRSAILTEVFFCSRHPPETCHIISKWPTTGFIHIPRNEFVMLRIIRRCIVCEILIVELNEMFHKLHAHFSVFLTFIQCWKWAGICRYTIPELLFLNFIPALINTYHTHLSFSVFLTAYSFFTFKKYTGTFPFRVLHVRLGIPCGLSLHDAL